MTGKKSIIFSIVMAVAGAALLAAYMIAVTPNAVRLPRLDHAHMRLALFVDGHSVNFAGDAFQKLSQAVCTDELSEEPIHFHDHKNQFVHLHWKGLTGGVVLKNYGWNLIGGTDELLGYRADRLPLLNRVPIYGDVLPKLPANDTLWVYSGAPESFTQRNTQDFLSQDLETFFGRKSTVGAQPTDFWRDLLFAPAAAHDGESHAQNSATPSQAELADINNLLGNVVIFAQPDRPSDAQVKVAFAHLEPLSQSTCGG